jgi:hypothetical protein
MLRPLVGPTDIVGHAMKALFLTNDSPSSRVQIEPFHDNRQELVELHDFHFTEQSLRTLGEIDISTLDRFDIVFVQSKVFRHHPDLLGQLLRAIGTQKVILDDQDSAGVVDADAAAFADLYVKKQVLRRLDDYRLSHSSQRIHAHYVDCVDGLSEPTSFEVPDSFPDKLVLGWNLGLANAMQGRLRDCGPTADRPAAERPIDISMRVSVDFLEPTHWYRRHRQRALDTVSALSGRFRVACHNQVLPPREYQKELANSKICLSPWGYGEVCFRDFEVVMAGALLVKPSMEHLVTEPNIYRPGETYLPVRPDFADLEEVCAFYLAHEEERWRITRAALSAYRRYFSERGFFRQVSEILGRLGRGQSARRPAEAEGRLEQRT